MTRRRLGALIIEAAPGWVRQAKGIIGQTIRSVLGVRKWRTPPHWVDYVTAAEMASLGTAAQPRFTLEVTDEEWIALEEALFARFQDEGWSGIPYDGYHD